MLTKSDIIKYFTAEKQESLLFLGIGIIAIILSILAFFVWKTPFWKGAIFTLMTVGILQIIVGFTVFSRSDKDIIRVTYQLEKTPPDLRTSELPRMQVVMKNFMWYRWVEIFLFTTGVLLVWLYKNNNNAQFWNGLGTALAIQAILMLGADYFAERRGKMYLQQLQYHITHEL